MKKTKNALVILAGGTGKRFNKKLPKQFNEINGTNLIDFFLNRIDTTNFDIILVVIKKSYLKIILQAPFYYHHHERLYLFLQFLSSYLLQL